MAEVITSELVDNFSLHSRSNLAICAVQWYPRNKVFHLAIGDYGIGIRNSLAMKPSLYHLLDLSHGKAAAKAFEAGVGRREEGGMGLTDVREMMPSLNGSLFLSTGDAWVFTRGPDEFRVGKQEYDLPGVQIEIVIPTED
jgi:hypothetical protein